MRGSIRIGLPAANHAPRLRVVGAAALVAAVLASIGIASIARRDSVRVGEIRFEYVREIGLRRFEDPVASLQLLEAALRTYSKELEKIGAEDEARLLEPLALTSLGRFAAVVADDPTSISIAGLELGKRFQGVYATVLDELAKRRALGFLDLELPKSPAERSPSFGAAQAFFESISALDYGPSGERLILESDALAVRFNVDENNTAVFDQNGSERLPLPRVLRLGGVDPSSLPALARQIESSLESVLRIGAAGGQIRLNFTVGAELVDAQRAGESQLRVRVGYVGPAGSAGIPISEFLLAYVGGDGKEVKSVADGGEYDLPGTRAVLAATRLKLYRVTDDGRTYLTDFAPEASESDAIDVTLEQQFGQDPSAGEYFSVSALQAVMVSILQTLQSEDAVEGGGLMGVYVDALPNQVDMSQGGTESPNRLSKAFALKVVPGLVGGVRVVAAGERVDPEDRVDPEGARFDRLRARSPFVPGTPPRQVLRSRRLTEFLDRSSRYPGRRVDAALTAVPPPPPGSVPGAGSIGLDFLVTETKPWSLYAQTGNTGTEATGEWATRLGYFNSDFLGNDELFSLEFITTNLENSNAVNGYFDAPLGDSERTRWKVFGGWNEYTAEDVGFAFADFEGSSPFLGLEVSHNIFQHGKYFFDVVVGGNWTNVQVTNGLTARTGDEDFFIPRAGLRLQRSAREAITDCSLFLDYGMGSSTSQSNLNALGRIAADKDWQVLRWDLSQSFYIDPLVRRADDRSPGSLAHELYFRARGQYAFDHRLVPQFMAVAGGFYSVRGYPQSVVAGDDAYLFTAEYRFHLPQVLGFDANPEPLFKAGDPFRFRPQYSYGPTDWDLIFRGFVDMAWVNNSERRAFETDSELLGVGVGVELKFLRNFNLRADIGFPMEDVAGTTTDDYQINFVGTISY